VLTFFIAGLLFICASSTSITWERTASRPETGLLIPSVYDIYPGPTVSGLSPQDRVEEFQNAKRRR
jgi:hypothetical protein